MDKLTRKDITLAPASAGRNFGQVWYVMVGSRCLAMVFPDQSPDEWREIIDAALDELNADTEAYLATI